MGVDEETGSARTFGRLLAHSLVVDDVLGPLNASLLCWLCSQAQDTRGGGQAQDRLRVKLNGPTAAEGRGGP